MPRFACCVMLPSGDRPAVRGAGPSTGGPAKRRGMTHRGPAPARTADRPCGRWAGMSVMPGVRRGVGCSVVVVVGVGPGGGVGCGDPGGAGDADLGFLVRPVEGEGGDAGGSGAEVLAVVALGGLQDSRVAWPVWQRAMMVPPVVSSARVIPPPAAGGVAEGWAEGAGVVLASAVLTCCSLSGVVVVPVMLVPMAPVASTPMAVAAAAARSQPPMASRDRVRRCGCPVMVLSCVSFTVR
jgi:hypothetical protein